MPLAILALLLVFIRPVTAAEAIDGRVVGVADGDTLTLLTADQRQVKVRLAEIDTPEKGQPWGERAKQALSSLAFGKAVQVIEQDVDRYGRTVGRVYVDALDVNAEMVRAGHAWVYRRYSRDPKLLTLEQEARTAGRGLWGLPEAQRAPPWEWRRQKRDGDKVRPSVMVPDMQCGTKRYCREMASCAEAQFYLSECGLTRLDGDGDGVPCEALCR